MGIHVQGLRYVFFPAILIVVYGLTYFHLAKKPAQGEKIVFNVSWEKGNKNIQLVKSYRFEFNENNWNIPAFAAIQLDPKLDKTVSAEFKGLSGNIRLAWTIVFITIALIFSWPGR